MNNKRPKSIRLDQETRDKVAEFMTENNIENESVALRELIQIGLDMSKEIKRNERAFKLVLLKSHFLLRRIIEMRGSDVLTKMDEEFDTKKDQLLDLVYNHGVSDYDAE